MCAYCGFIVGLWENCGSPPGHRAQLMGKCQYLTCLIGVSNITIKNKEEADLKTDTFS